MATALDIFGDSDSEEEFIGFSREDVAIFDLMNQNGDDDEIDLAESDDSESEGDEPDGDQEGPAAFINWNNDPSEVQVPGFTEHVGPTRQLPCDATPIQFFLLLFTTELIDLIVKYTNSNAVEMILSDAAGNVEGTLAWTPTSSEEIMAFLGIVILMGIVKLPSTQLYWSRDERLHQRGVTKIFPRDRFNLLLKYFYCNDPEQLPHKDPEYKLYRVKPILEQLSQNFLDLYDPHRA